MEKILIERPREYQAQTGELLEMHFGIIAFPGLRNLQINAITANLNKDSHLKVEKSSLIGNDLSFQVRIVNNPFPLVLAIVSVTTVLAGFFVWGSVDKVYKILEEPAGQLLSMGAVAGSIAAIFGLLMLARGRS